MDSKKFSEKLNHCLDEMSAPQNLNERAQILSKLVHISKSQATSLLSGQQYPNEELITKITNELELE